MDLRLTVQDERFIATSPDLPGARAHGHSPDAAVERLHALQRLATRPSPYATVQKRLSERYARTTTSDSR